MSKKQITNFKFVPAASSPSLNLYPNTVALIRANEKFIIEETTAYIAYNVANNIAPFQYYSYNADKCRRDISYVLEGYITDIRHGGNRQTVNNAQKYFVNGIPQVRQFAESNAHTFILDLIQNYVLTNLAYPSSKQNINPQVINLAYTTEANGYTQLANLANIIINVITNGLTSVPAVINNRGYVKFPGYYKSKDILLITNTTRNVVMYNFADATNPIDVTYYEGYDSDFPGALYGNDEITTVTFDIDTSGMLVTDNIQIFVEGPQLAVKLNPIATDAMERLKVGIPQSQLDADFEYGLQPTKWQAVSILRGYPSVYEIPGSDQSVVNVVTDASAGTGGIGASQITVTTVAAHGFSVGDPFTIKALAASILGFGRAEGTFLVASVPSTTTFTYYAKAQVGTTNPTTLSTTYTQLRKAGYYTGASVGSPSFNVISNATTGTFTTVLTANTGSNVIGFSGSVPPNSSVLTVSGLATGTQVTGVTGTGGTAAASQLASTAAVGVNSITVVSTTGILPGLLLDRGDGVGIAVAAVNGNVLSLSGVLTSQILGISQTYVDQTGTTVSTNGTGALITITRQNTSYSAQVGSNNGAGYQAGDTITILGTSLNGLSPANDAVVTVVSANPQNSVATFNNSSLVSGTSYTTGSGIAVTGGTGTGLTVDIVANANGLVTSVSVHNSGSGYTVGDVVTITGGDSNANIAISSLNVGGDIISLSVSGTAITAPAVNFVSAITLSTPSTGTLAPSTSVSYTSIALIEVTFTANHGFVPGNTITVQITSSGSNNNLAGGAFFVEQTPTPLTLRYSARAAGIIANTLVGNVYARPDSFYIHRPYDGGVQLGTGGPTHGATAIRMSKKYFRYQSGKGIMYNTGALFAPSYYLRSVSANGTAIGSTITVTTDDTDHGCQVGAQIKLFGIQTAGYNGVFTVSSIIDERNLTVTATTALGSTTAILGDPCQMSVYKWHGSTVRSGTFDDSNGMFWQYDGQQLAVVKRSSIGIIAGTIAIQANSNTVTGTNTRFTQQLGAGDRIVIKGMTHVVSSIASDTQMYVTPDYRGVNDVTQGKASKIIDLIVPQAYFNIDTLDGNGPSGYYADPTKMQMIGMQWTWYGAGFIDFMLRGPNGDYIFVHRFRNSNINPEAYMRTGNQPVRYEVNNEGARDKLAVALGASDTSMTLTNSYFFPPSGTVIVDQELISYTGNVNNVLYGLTRGTTLRQFVAGSTRSFSGTAATSHIASAGVILVSSLVSPLISHWGSAFLLDGQFDSDRGYLFNYASTGITVTLDQNTAFLIRLAPSVSNAQTGDLGDRELLNRAQFLLQNLSITSDPVASGGGGIVIVGILNPSNYPTDPTKITWSAINTQAAGGQPSFAQIAPGGSVTWSGNFSTTTSTIQGAFTTSLIARSFAPSSYNINAIGFAAATQTASAQSFGYANQTLTATSFNAGSPLTVVNQNITALGFAAGQPYGNNAYVSATSTTRNDILISNTQYDSLTAISPGDLVSGSNFAANTYIVSITRAYNAGAYTRIVLSNNPTVNSFAGSGNNVTASTSNSTRYIYATNSNRTDILVPNSQWTALSPTPNVGNGITGSNFSGGTTIASVTTSYAGTSYTRVVLNQPPSVTSTAGSGNNVSATASTLVSSTYQSALSTTRNDFLIPDTLYDTLAANNTISVGDGLSATTYITGGQTITSFTRTYIAIAGVNYTRIVMSAVANSTSPAASTTGGNNINVTITSSIAATFLNGLSTSRSTFLVSQTSYAAASALRNSDVLSAATYLTGGQTISSSTPNYANIGGVAYALIQMSGFANATVTGGASSTAVTGTSSITATYGSAISSTRSDFLVTDSDWTSSGIAVGDGLTLATYITGGQQINSVTTGYVTISSVSYTRIVMTANGNATSTSGAGNNQTITVTAAGTASSYNKTNYLFFDSTSWTSSGATIGTKVATSFTGFPAGTSVTGLSTRTYGSTTIYRVTFTQSATTSLSASSTVTWTFGSAYALPGETVFSFLSNPGGSDSIDFSKLKELTSTSIGGRGTFPNGPDVLAINVYKTAGTATTANLVLRWSEAQA